MGQTSVTRPVRILVVHHTLHHAAASGRSGGSAFLDPDVTVDGLGSSLPYSIAFGLTRLAIGDEYGSLGLQREVEALRVGHRLAPSAGASVHFMSAEHDAKYLPVLAHRLGWYTSAWFHKPPDRIAKMLARRRSLLKLDRAWAISNSQVPVLESHFGSDRVAVAPHGVDTERFCPATSEVRERRVLFLGAHLRDFAQLRRIYRALARRDPGIDLRVVVPGHSRELVQGVPGEVMSGISDDALLDELRRAGVVFLPLLDATANVSLLEAMATGCPVVTTDVGGVREYAGDAAEVLPPGDDAATIEAIVRMLDDPAHAQAMSEKARRRSLQYSWAAVAAPFAWAGDVGGGDEAEEPS